MAETGWRGQGEIKVETLLRDWDDVIGFFAVGHHDKARFLKSVEGAYLEEYGFDTSEEWDAENFTPEQVEHKFWLIEEMGKFTDDGLTERYYECTAETQGARPVTVLETRE